MMQVAVQLNTNEMKYSEWVSWKQCILLCCWLITMSTGTSYLKIAKCYYYLEQWKI